MNISDLKQHIHNTHLNIQFLLKPKHVIGVIINYCLIKTFYPPTHTGFKAALVLAFCGSKPQHDTQISAETIN